MPIDYSRFDAVDYDSDDMACGEPETQGGAPAACSADSYLKDVLGLHGALRGDADADGADPADPQRAALAGMTRWLDKAGRYEAGRNPYDSALYVGMATLEAAKGSLPLHACAPVFAALAEHKLVLNTTCRDARCPPGMCCFCAPEILAKVDLTAPTAERELMKHFPHGPKPHPLRARGWRDARLADFGIPDEGSDENDFCDGDARHCAVRLPREASIAAH